MKKYLIPSMVLVLTLAIQAFCDNSNRNVEYPANSAQYIDKTGGITLMSNAPQTHVQSPPSASNTEDRRKRQVHLTGSEISYQEAMSLVEKHNIRRRNETSSNMQIMVSTN